MEEHRLFVDDQELAEAEAAGDGRDVDGRADPVGIRGDLVDGRLRLSICDHLLWVCNEGAGRYTPKIEKMLVMLKSVVVELAAATDAELVKAIAQASDVEAEGELCRRMAPRLRLYGLRHLRNEQAAADLMQQVLIVM